MAFSHNCFVKVKLNSNFSIEPNIPSVSTCLCLSVYQNVINVVLLVFILLIYTVKLGIQPIQLNGQCLYTECRCFMYLIKACQATMTFCRASYVIRNVNRKCLCFRDCSASVLTNLCKSQQELYEVIFFLAC